MSGLELPTKGSMADLGRGLLIAAQGTVEPHDICCSFTNWCSIHRIDQQSVTLKIEI